MSKNNEILIDVENKSAKRKQEILNSEDNLKVTGNVYYVSTSGDDANDGKSPETPWKTLAKVNEGVESVYPFTQKEDPQDPLPRGYYHRGRRGGTQGYDQRHQPPFSCGEASHCPCHGAGSQRTSRADPCAASFG